MHFDVIVIGMGLSGLMAAKTAIDVGKRVLMVGKGMGTLGLLSNTIDLLGIVPKAIGVKAGLTRWMNDHPDHPYSKAGWEGIEEGLASFLSLFPGPYSFQSLADSNCLMPTGAGTFRPTYLFPTTMTAGTTLKDGEGLIVGFEGFKDFYAKYVADHLGCQGVNLSLPGASHREISATTLARWMEQEAFREGTGREIKRHLAGQTKVGLPAILGVREPSNVKKSLEEIVGAEVFEIPMLPPSIPGIRIFNRFREWLVGRGVRFLLGHPVSKVFIEGRRCGRLEVANPPLVNFYSADHYILATGRFISRGLVADRERIYEPLFGLPVVQPSSHEDWFGKSFWGDLSHPVHEAGVLINSSFRPTDENGSPILDNVRVAGSILAHHHCIDEKSREGIEIATGYMAAKHALAASK